MSWWQWLRNWLRPGLTHVEMVLYTRQGCHLCDDALQSLKTAQRRHGFRLTVLDVDSNPAWVEAYGEQVPVVAVAGKVRFRGRVNEILLERTLRGLARHLRRVGE